HCLVRSVPGTALGVGGRRQNLDTPDAGGRLGRYRGDGQRRAIAPSTRTLPGALPRRWPFLRQVAERRETTCDDALPDRITERRPDLGSSATALCIRRCSSLCVVCSVFQMASSSRVCFV